MTNTTANTSGTVELDTELSAIFLQAEKTMGLVFKKTDSKNPQNPDDDKTFHVKDAVNGGKLIGLFKLAPFTTRETAAFANSAEDKTMSAISISLNLQKPEDGQAVLLDREQVQKLRNLTNNAFSTLASRHRQPGLKLRTNVVGGPASPTPFS